MAELTSVKEIERNKTLLYVLSEIGSGEGTMDHLLASLSTITGLRFINDAIVAPGTKILWTQHDSSLDRGHVAEPLGNLSRQTSLGFRRQNRPVEVWSVSEK